MIDLKNLLLEIVVICSAARILGWGFEKLHQPRVVGEILAGILLGPSLLGWRAPAAFTLLFPSSGLAPLYFLSQIGLALFMFQVGVGLDLQEFRRLGRTVVILSNVSRLVPLLAGSTLALYLYPDCQAPRCPSRYSHCSWERPSASRLSRCWRGFWRSEIFCRAQSEWFRSVAPRSTISPPGAFWPD